MSRSINRFVSSFAALNTTQFFSALNDNVYKLLLIFFLIGLKGPEHSNTILALAGAIFVIPFLLFASTSGSIADRFSKRSVIFVTRGLEILIMSLGVLAFYFSTAVGGYAVLFLLATQSALFSPCKYGIIPEIVEQEQISRCNGILTATTYMAIIVGTFLASFLTTITHRNFVLSGLICVVFALLGGVVSLAIQPTLAQAKGKRVSARFLSDIYRTLRRARKQRYLLTTIIFGAYFLFMGAYTQLNIIPFTLQSLGMTEVEGGYLFLMTAIGIGLGSFLAGRLADKEIELGFVPLSCLAAGITFLLLFAAEGHLALVVPLLIFLGFFGGFFVVPIDAYIQVASLNEDRGQNVAAGNFLSFLGVVVASFLIAFLGNFLNLSAAIGFMVIGWITLVVALSLGFLMADQILRLLVAFAGKLVWRLTVVGREQVRLSPPVLLVGERSSWLDTIVVMATLPRMIRYVVPISGKHHRSRSLFYRLLRLIPIAREELTPTGREALRQIRRELLLGHSVCLMHPVEESTKNLPEWEEKLKELLDHVKIPIVPIHIRRKSQKSNRSYLKQLRSLFAYPIRVSYGQKIAKRRAK